MIGTKVWVEGHLSPATVLDRKDEGGTFDRVKVRMSCGLETWVSVHSIREYDIGATSEQAQETTRNPVLPR